MATMKVSLPDAMLAWVEGQTRSGRYPNASEYVRDLIRRDQEHADRIAHLQRLVDEGLGSGVGERSLREVRAEARAAGGEWIECTVTVIALRTFAYCAENFMFGASWTQALQVRRGFGVQARYRGCRTFRHVKDRR